MNLNQAIIYCLEQSKQKNNKECVLDYFQLAKWLAELRTMKSEFELLRTNLCWQINKINKIHFTEEELMFINEENNILH